MESPTAVMSATDRPQFSRLHSCTFCISVAIRKHYGAFFRHALDGAVLWVREGGRDGGREGRRERPGEREGLAELQGKAGKRDRLVAWKIQNNRVR